MNDDDRYPLKTVFVSARTPNASVAFNLDSLREENRLKTEVNGEVFTAIYDERFDTGYIFRGNTDATATINGASAYDVSWSGGETPKPIDAFQAMWFAMTAFYPETTVHG